MALCPTIDAPVPPGMNKSAPPLSGDLRQALATRASNGGSHWGPFVVYLPSFRRKGKFLQLGRPMCPFVTPAALC